MKLTAKINQNTEYKINPEFDQWETDTYKLYSVESDGMLFWRKMEGEDTYLSLDHLSYFSNNDLNDGLLIEA